MNEALVYCLEAVNWRERLTVMSDGQVYPITTVVLKDGTELNVETPASIWNAVGPNELLSLVCGKADRWFALDMRKFSERSFCGH